MKAEHRLAERSSMPQFGRPQSRGEQVSLKRRQVEEVIGQPEIATQSEPEREVKQLLQAARAGRRPAR